MTTNNAVTPSFKGLIPFIVFISIFLGVGIAQNDFYALPAPIAVIAGILIAFLLFGQSIPSKIETFLKGCGDHKILTMCLIYLLAGAFAAVTKATGSVDSIVNLGLDMIQSQFIYLGVFIIAAFLSVSTGTSVGAIVALGPIVIGFGDTGVFSLSILCGALLGGAMFGDNLSVISDTTIAATQSLGVNMSDKFKENIKIALPAALTTMGVLVFFGLQIASTTTQDISYSYSIIKIMPYILVIILSVIGVNVFITLLLGVVSAGILGVIYSDFTTLEFTRIAYSGFTNMTEIFLLSLLTGGLAALVAKNGGIAFILEKTRKVISGKTSAQFGIATLVSAVNIAIANNTVSIIITGPIAKTINTEYDLDAKKTASLLDIFACITQGVLPYGAQVLLLLSLADGAIGYFNLLLNTWYIALLFLSTVLFVIFRK
ncbi:MAG: Na+/H+ antiporter NhaC family protein [Bizionia paragorgiae]|uniref:Na+/H+ antiporter NhaC family protein n=1 Tax=Bizionia paragorgiae TaxID=283786 RepID=UPI003C3C16F0